MLTAGTLKNPQIWKHILNSTRLVKLLRNGQHLDRGSARQFFTAMCRSPSWHVVAVLLIQQFSASHEQEDAETISVLSSAGV